jgi:hypothetical protein
LESITVESALSRAWLQQATDVRIQSGGPAIARIGDELRQIAESVSRADIIAFVATRLPLSDLECFDTDGGGIISKELTRWGKIVFYCEAHDHKLHLAIRLYPRHELFSAN